MYRLSRSQNNFENTKNSWFWGNARN